MAISTKNLKLASYPTELDRTEKTKKIMEYHEPAFHMLNEDNPIFYPKNTFNWDDEQHVSLFKSELVCNVFYTELVDKNYDPLDPNRTLYKFRGNPNYINEYFSKTETGKTGEYKRYFVPLHDFEKVDLSTLFSENKPKIVKEFNGPKLTLPFIEEEIIDDRDDEDALMSKLTIRDHAAIQWKLPVSNKEWLNKLIKQINKV